MGLRPAWNTSPQTGNATSSPVTSGEEGDLSAGRLSSAEAGAGEGGEQAPSLPQTLSRCPGGPASPE